MGSAGIGSAGHLAGELFNMMAGVSLVHVPYRGNGPALAALLGGEVEIVFPTPPSSIEFIRAGKLRGLATTGAARSEALPDMPTVDEFVPGYESSGWYGVGGPTGTPAEIVNKLRAESKKAAEAEQFKKAIDNIGDVVAYLDQPEFARFWDEDAKRVEAAVQAIGKV